jgi:hypothetical protein
MRVTGDEHARLAAEARALELKLVAYCERVILKRKFEVARPPSIDWTLPCSRGWVASATTSTSSPTRSTQGYRPMTRLSALPCAARGSLCCVWIGGGCLLWLQRGPAGMMTMETIGRIRRAHLGESIRGIARRLRLSRQVLIVSRTGDRCAELALEVTRAEWLVQRGQHRKP